MPIVLTNGVFYIRTSKTGGIKKTSDIKEAQSFYSMEVAMKKKNKAPGKCKSYFPYDTENYVTEPTSINTELTSINNDGIRKKRNRKKYSATQRKIIYDRGKGICQLCGRKISVENMTLDHIIPLDAGGEESMDNLQLSCETCNRYKANILPEKFFDRITEIFMYQMEKRYENNLNWEVARKLLMEIL